MYEARSYCINCGKKCEYRIFDKLINHVIKDVKFSCLEKRAFCCEYGNPVYVTQIHDENIEAEILAYNEARGD